MNSKAKTLLTIGLTFTLALILAYFSDSSLKLGEGTALQEQAINGQNDADQDTSAEPALVASTFDLDALETQQHEGMSRIIYRNGVFEGFVSTDKVVYRPNDVIFINSYFVEAYNKTPYGTPDSKRYYDDCDYCYYYYYDTFYIDISDPSATSIYKNYTNIENGTVSHTYKIPADISGGEYLIKVWNSDVPPAYRKIRIREYERNDMSIVVSLGQDSYRPGDNVMGQVKVTSIDGAIFNEELKYSITASFEDNQVNQTDMLLSSDGLGVFSIQIPSNTSMSFASLVFNVQYKEISTSYAQTIVISQPSSMFIYFNPETYYYAYDVPSKVYFQVFTDDQMTTTSDFEGASLVAYGDSGQIRQVIIDSQISTEHRGKGVFTFTPQDDMEYFLEFVDQASNELVKQSLLVIEQPEIDFMEVSFTLKNDDKVLENDEDLSIQIYVNDRVNQDDVFLVQVAHKDKIMYKEQLEFSKNKTYELTIKADEFKLLNGAVLQLNLFQINNIPFWFDRSKNNSQTLHEENILVPRGEILFFKKPSKHLNVQISTDKHKYGPGENVTFEVSVMEASSGQLVTDKDAFVTVFVTDESVFAKIDDKQQPPSFVSQVYLEHEVLNNNFEISNNDEYLEHLFNATLGESLQSKDRNLDLLLGVQGWRQEFFIVQNMKYQMDKYNSLSREQQIAVQNLVGECKDYTYYVSYESYYYDDSSANSTAIDTGINLSMASPVMSTTQSSGGAAMGTGIGTAAAAPTSLAVEESSDESSGSGSGSASGSSSAQQLFPEPPKSSSNPTNADILNMTQIFEDYMNNVTVNTRRYAHILRPNYRPDQRVDLTETVFYAAAMKTQNGKVNGTFALSDLITKFRITANAYDVNGTIGYSTHSFQSQKAFYINFDLPASLSPQDSIDIPVTIFNNLDQELQIALEVINADPDLEIEMVEDLKTVDGQSNLMTLFRVTPLAIKNQTHLYIRATATNGNTNLTDSLVQTTEVVPSGFLSEESTGGFIGTYQSQALTTPKKASLSYRLPESLEKNTVEFNVKIFSTNYAQLMEAIESLIQDPYGCFEQASSTTYPLIMAQQFLQSYYDQNDEIKALQVDIASRIQKGHKLLMKYQTSDGGFELFGVDPGDVRLSAYGLMEFTDMAKVSTLVDSTMLYNLKQFILNKKDGQGGFNQSEEYWWYYDSPRKNTTNAYIVWALTSTGETNVTEEIDALIDIAEQQISGNEVNTYFLALLANSLYNLNRTEQAEKYADELLNYHGEKGNITNATHAVMYSWGLNLDLEVTALTTMVWQNNREKYLLNIERAMDFMIRRIKGGRYGTTQATILCLKAITSYMKHYPYIDENGAFVLSFNNQEIQRRSFTPQTKSTIQFDLKDFIREHKDDQFKAGSELIFDLEVVTESNATEQQNSTEKKGFKMNYSMNLRYQDLLPPLSESQLSFKVNPKFEAVQLGHQEQTGKAFSYELVVKNEQSNQEQGMGISIFRMPSCLEVNFNLLEELKRNKAFDYYEVRSSNTEIIMYWRNFKPGEEKTVTLDLLQRYSGKCYQRPHTAYLYYNDDQKVHVPMDVIFID